MIRTGEQYREGLRDGREVWIDGEQVKDVSCHPALKPIVDIRARIFDMQHEDVHASTLTYVEDNTQHSIFNRLPRQQQDWHDKRAACDAVMNDIKGVVTRVGDETVGEMWSLYDGRDVLNEIDPRFGNNIANHIQAVIETDVFHVSANTDPKGDRSKAPQDQDPDMMVHVVKETDAGIVVRGAKYETASGYADQAFLKPTVGAWTSEQLSDYAVGGIVKMGAPGVKHIARSGFAGRASAQDYPLANKFDEVDFLMVLDNVLIPWEDVFFYRHTKAAQYIRGTLHRYSAFPYTLRVLYVADMMIGAAVWNARQTGLDKLQSVREKLADLVCYREGINAHLTASIAMAQKSPGGLLMPHQSMLYAGRVFACSNLPQMMHTARELCGGQICVTQPPSAPPVRGRGSKNSTASTTIGGPRTAASCSPSPATCSIRIMPDTGSLSSSLRRHRISITSPRSMAPSISPARSISFAGPPISPTRSWSERRRVACPSPQIQHAGCVSRAKSR